MFKNKMFHINFKIQFIPWYLCLVLLIIFSPTYAFGKIHHLQANRPIYSFSNAKKFNSFVIKNKKLKSKPSENEIWDQWQIALWAPQFNKSKLSLKVLDWLLIQRQSIIPEDSIHLTYGRVFYQLGDFKNAIKHYKRVPIKSNYWFEAKEEIAWSMLRLRQHENVISELATIANPVFSNVLLSEPYFLKSLAHLQICDYKKVFDTTQLFKKHFSQRIDHLDKLSKGQSQVDFDQLFESFRGKPFELSTIGSLSIQLPYLFWTDEFFQRDVKKWLINNSSQSKKNAIDRITVLAKNDLKEISNTIQKLHIIEAESIQRMYMDEHNQNVSVQSSLNKTDSDNKITFPYTNEIWLDELDSYNAKIKNCPELTKASL